MTAIKIILKEIQKTEDKNELYTDSQSFMQSIEYNKENQSILNQIQGTLTTVLRISQPQCITNWKNIFFQFFKNI